MARVTAPPTAPPSAESTWRTMRRGLALSPELRVGPRRHARAGHRVDGRPGRRAGRRSSRASTAGCAPRAARTSAWSPSIVAITAGVLVVTTVCGYLMMRRLFTVSETALASVRTRTFRHVHDLSMLHQQSERRGSLVSRVTSDVDQITQFLQWGGVILLISVGQIVVTSGRHGRLLLAAHARGVRRVRAGRAGHPARSSGGWPAPTAWSASRSARCSPRSPRASSGPRSSGRTGCPAAPRRGSTRRSTRHRRAQQRALRTSVLGFSTGELAAGLALAAVVVVGVLLGVDGALTIGQLTAFLFLVDAVRPAGADRHRGAQRGAERDRRLAPGARRARHRAGRGRPGRGRASTCRPGRWTCASPGCAFAYPADGPTVLHDVDVEISAKTRVAVVGETGSGKTTFAKLLTRLMDPTRGEVLLSGVPLPRVRFASLRPRVVMVPQDGFLFDATVAENVRFGRPALTDDGPGAGVHRAGPGRLGGRAAARAWPPPVGERGEALSVGERQLVALARAYVADPDLLVLDEATSAVDPATEVRLQRTLDAVTRGPYDGGDRAPALHRPGRRRGDRGRRGPDRAARPARGAGRRARTRSTPGSTPPGWSRPAEPARACRDLQTVRVGPRGMLSAGPGSRG